MSDISSLGGVYSEYVADFTQWSQSHWTSEGAGWVDANYYDRAKIYYEWWAATGNDTYLQRANALVLDYRVNYLEANNYGPAAHWAMMAGVALHYAVTGDAADLSSGPRAPAAPTGSSCSTPRSTASSPRSRPTGPIASCSRTSSATTSRSWSACSTTR
jgi:hypothetical protein